MITSTAFANWLQSTVRDLGGLAAGCLRVDGHATPDLAARFADWLATGNRGRLAYLDRSVAERSQPFARLPEAKSVIVVLFRGDWADGAGTHDGLIPGLPPAKPGEPVGYVSLYAAGRDYHVVGRNLLTALAQRLQAEQTVGAVVLDVAVDTRPVPDVFLAALAGLGVMGRNCLLRIPQYGSRVFVGSLWLGAELPEIRGTARVAPTCTACGACVRACPTGALAADGFVHLARCRSYLSMEYRGALTGEQASSLGHCLVGCDACTACCPPALPEPHGVPVDLGWLITATTAEIRRAIAGNALDYAGVTLLRRNAVAVLANSGHPHASELLAHLAATSRSPVVQQTLANVRG